MPQEVTEKISSLLKDYNVKQIIELKDIAKFHAGFENIHPFQDGNGRVGCMLLLKQCLDAELTPVIIEDENKSLYYRFLSLAQEKHDYAKLIRFLKKSRTIIRKK